MPRHLSHILQGCIIAALGMLMAVRRWELSVVCRLRWFAGEREGRGSSARPRKRSSLLLAVQSFPRPLIRCLVGLVDALDISYRGLCIDSLLGGDWRARRRLQQLSRTRLGELGKTNGGGKTIDNVDLPYQS